MQMCRDYSEKKPITVGPWGGQDGIQWDDGVCSGVRQLVINHAAGIDSIQIEYDLKGSCVWSDKHGGLGGITTDQVKLDYPDEYLTSIQGYYGSINEWGTTIVRSLTFESNKKTYGPFGVQQGKYFSFPMSGAKIVGFHGKAGWYIDSIGVYLKSLYNPLPNPSKAVISSQQNMITSATEKVNSYTVVQGSVGQDYDIVLALKQKKEKGKPQQNIKPSSSSSDDESSKHKVIGYPVSTTKESIASSYADGPVSYGPWGGRGGTIFDDGTYTGIRHVFLKRNVGITSIQVLYDRNGQSIWGNKNGGSGSIKTDKIYFDYPYEVLTHISGYYGPTMMLGPTVIQSLTFHTTKKKYGPFGDEQGTFFSSNLKEGMVVGFHGRKAWFLDGIGVHVLEGKLSLPQPPPPPVSLIMNDLALTDQAGTTQWPNNLLREKRAPKAEVLNHMVVKEPVPCGPGPWGGDGGRPWDDGVFTGIKQIFLTKAEVVCSIQIEYDRNGQSVWSVSHGGSGAGDTTYRIKFECPHEVVTCISGFYGSIGKENAMKVIRSLTFHSTRGSYGPYGEEIGTYFTSTKTEGKVVGFHGRSGLYLDAIGVHMQHWLGDTRSSKSSLFKKFP